MRALGEALGLAGQKVLVLTDGVKPAVFLSGRNLPTVHVMPYTDVSTYHVLWSDAVVIESGALGGGGGPPPPRVTRRRGRGGAGGRPGGGAGEPPRRRPNARPNRPRSGR